MTTLKQGDLIKAKNGRNRKVMETCGTILHVSLYDNFDKYAYTTDESSLKEDGYTWDTPAWEPSKSQKYWCISSVGEAICDFWNDTAADQARRDLLGIYETEELAQAALLEIRRRLGK